eukprot:GDKH01008982.1.p1 GENE.GDKH01008982.1~~GDKH01008982.1.p1  ORF type:complete len:236 (-),score=22.15 GDKH01008982.1:150-857(-)
MHSSFRGRNSPSPSMAVSTQPQYDHLIKLLLIGDSGVGKSCLLLRFSDNLFTQSHISTIGIDFKIKTVDIDGYRVKLQIWDTAGQERFRTITQTYYRSAMGILLVYDVTNPESFNNIRHWMRQIDTHAAENVNKILIGNKADLEDRKISTAAARQLADEFGVPFVETSAKSGQNVGEAFITIGHDILHRIIAAREAGQRDYELRNQPGAGMRLGTEETSTSADGRKRCCARGGAA